MLPNSKLAEIHDKNINSKPNKVVNDKENKINFSNEKSIDPKMRTIFGVEERMNPSGKKRVRTSDYELKRNNLFSKSNTINKKFNTSIYKNNF